MFSRAKGTNAKGTSAKGASAKGTSDKGTSDKGTSAQGTSAQNTSDTDSVAASDAPIPFPREVRTLPILMADPKPFLSIVPTWMPCIWPVTCLTHGRIHLGLSLLLLHFLPSCTAHDQRFSLCV